MTTVKQASDSSLREAIQVRKAASVIQEAASILRSYAQTQDYFNGYSLAEVLQSRINEIGEDEGIDAFIGNRRTKIAGLNYLKESVDNAVDLLLGVDEINVPEQDSQSEL